MYNRIMKRPLLIAGFLYLAVGAAHADFLHSPRFKSPAGKYEIIIASAGTSSLPFAPPMEPAPPGQKPRYVLLFYVAGGSDPVSADWYTDVDPAPSAPELASSLMWSPNEDYVVVSHGQNAKEAVASRWLISLKSPFAYGFQGDHLYWVDTNRLVADLKTKKVPGGIELVDANKHHAELIISPMPGLGFELSDSSGHQITVKQFLNHWGDEKDRTTWDSFTPACFELDLDTMKKRSVPCPT